MTTYRAASYRGRVSIILPKTLGSVSAEAKPHNGGVLITLHKSNDGIGGRPTKGADLDGPWGYEWKPKRPLPVIGMSPAELVSGLDEHGELKVFLPNNQKVRPRHEPLPRKRKERPAEPKPVPVATNGMVGLREAVKTINHYKAELGDNLDISLTAEGMLRILVEYR